MLCTLLDSHPEILCHHELFNPGGVFTALRYRNTDFGRIDIAERDRDPLGFLTSVWNNDLGHSRVGFKMTRRQQAAVLGRVLLDRDVQKIVLKRKNRLRTYVSELIAEQTGVWEAYSTAELETEPPVVTVAPNELFDHARKNDDYYSWIESELRASGQQYLNTYFEDLFSPRERRRILTYLGVRPTLRSLHIQSVQQNPASIAKLVGNFEELCSALEGSALQQDVYMRSNAQ